MSELKIPIDTESQHDSHTRPLPPQRRPFPATYLRNPWVILSLPLAIAALASTSVYWFSTHHDHSAQPSSLLSNGFLLPSWKHETGFSWGASRQKVDQFTRVSEMRHHLLSSSSWPGMPFHSVSEAGVEARQHQQEEYERDGLSADRYDMVKGSDLVEIAISPPQRSRQMAQMVAARTTEPATRDYGSCMQADMEAMHDTRAHQQGQGGAQGSGEDGCNAENKEKIDEGKDVIAQKEMATQIIVGDAHDDGGSIPRHGQPRGRKRRARRSDGNVLDVMGNTSRSTGSSTSASTSIIRSSSREYQINRELVSMSRSAGKHATHHKHKHHKHDDDHRNDLKVKQANLENDLDSTGPLEADDGDDEDNFPSNNMASPEADEDENEDVEEQDTRSNNNNDDEEQQQQRQQQQQEHKKHKHRNANLGTPGGNGPILLCSSNTCLPSLRDTILSKIALQVHHVMDHLRHRRTLLYMMDATAPETKDALMAAQEELVNRLEERIMKNLRDWVMGIHRPSKSHTTVASTVSTTTSSTSTSLNEGDNGGELDIFQLGHLGLEEVDEDDHGLEAKPVDKKVIASQTSQDTTTTTTTRETFVSADRVLMRQEWSRWIAHWVHRAKVLLLSSSLATHTLNDMNQIVMAGNNVNQADQRHWSWNLDKALATLMVASEMLCGGPPTADPALTASLSTPVTVRTQALTQNAQKCIDAWSDELDSILEDTATTA